MSIHYEDSRVTLHHGDCLDVLRTLPDASVDSVITDPPYGLREYPRRMVEDTLRAWLSGDRAYVPDGGAGFMGRAWDRFVPPPAAWDECFRVLKPGGHLIAFAGTRTYDLMGMSIRLAGLTTDVSPEIRDGLAWLHGQGFPKNHDVSKAIDKAAGAERETGPIDPARAGRLVNQRADYVTEAGWSAGGRSVTVDPPATDAAREWAGWGTALKPAFEPVVVARKPLGAGTVAANVLAHGTGALNIDGCRIGMGDEKPPTGSGVSMRATSTVTPYRTGDGPNVTPPAGRWPANVILDSEMAGVLDEQSGTSKDGVATNRNRSGQKPNEVYGKWGNLTEDQGYGGQGGASRFFATFPRDCGHPNHGNPDHDCTPFLYQAKAPKRERPVVDGVAHPTVKPLSLMRWLVRLVTPPGGTVLEPFAGSGTTVEACLLEGFQCIAIEKGDEYLPLIRERIARQDRARIEAEVTRKPDAARAIAEQVAGQLDIFGEATA